MDHEYTESQTDSFGKSEHRDLGAGMRDLGRGRGQLSAPPIMTHSTTTLTHALRASISASGHSISTTSSSLGTSSFPSTRATSSFSLLHLHLHLLLPPPCRAMNRPEKYKINKSQPLSEIYPNGSVVVIHPGCDATLFTFPAFPAPPSLSPSHTQRTHASYLPIPIPFSLFTTLH